MNTRERKLNKASELHLNPFWTLGATTRDDRRRIVELAEERSLKLDPALCQKARSDLTNPRMRLTVEMSWLPGVSPKKAFQLAKQIISDPMSARAESGLPSLAHANLLAASFAAVDGNDDPEKISEYIQEIATLVEELSGEEIMRDINEDRAVAGFPEIKALDQIEEVLKERKRYYRDTIKNTLKRLPPKKLVATMTITVESVTDEGEYHAPELIDDLVDGYEVEAQPFLQREAENVLKLVQAARDAAKGGEVAVKPVVDKLETVVRNWDMVAQPIQVSAKARGLEHEGSQTLAYSIRSLAIDLFNEHNMLSESQRITGFLQEVFAELPAVLERVEKDAQDLGDIFNNRKQSEVDKKEWEKSIFYSAEIGLVFKETLKIDACGVTWKNKTYRLQDINRVRWGAVRNSINGIPTGTDYTIAFGDNSSEAVVLTKKEDIYSNFIEKLWKSVGFGIMSSYLESLKSGKEVYIGQAQILDAGPILIRHKMFSSNEKVECSWSQVKIWSYNGDFFIGLDGDDKVNVSVSYMNTPNTHFLEQIIRMAFKKPGLRRLSELLT